MISLIAAAGLDGVIGKDNHLPWDKIKIDMQHFYNMTAGNTVVMGRKTFESIGSRSLQDRNNIVLTRDTSFQAKDINVLHSPSRVLLQSGGKHVFIIGGSELYRQFMEAADYIFLTRIFHHFDGDTFFPAIEKDQWEIKRQVNVGTDQSPYDLSFIIYGRPHHH